MDKKTVLAILLLGFVCGVFSSIPVIFVHQDLSAKLDRISADVFTGNIKMSHNMALFEASASASPSAKPTDKPKTGFRTFIRLESESSPSSDVK